jgi:hypothetical protein
MATNDVALRRITFATVLLARVRANVGGSGCRASIDKVAIKSR